MKLLKILIIVALLATGCGGKDTDPAPEPAPEVTGKSSLLFPAQNSVCTTGTVTSTTESTISFSWAVAANADTYELTAKNLITGAVTTRTSATNQLQVTLTRNAPYSWYITAGNTKTLKTAQSDTWKFYNAGAGIVNYAPFPAELISPTFNEAIRGTSVDLIWKGSSTDNNIAFYDVYLGNTTSPVLLKSNVTEMFLKNATVTPNTQFYWKIVTHDAVGNISTSDMGQFKVN